MANLKHRIKCLLYPIVAIRWFWIYFSKYFLYPCNYRKYGFIGETTILELPIYFTNVVRVYLEEYTKIRPGFNLINTPPAKFTLKRYSVIAPNCTVVTGNHTKCTTVPQRISGTYHIDDQEADITIGEDVWVGTNCTILSGGNIGRGAVIGACSLVNKPIPPYAVAVGSPAKIIASTFSLEEIIQHEKSLYPESERMSRSELEQLFDTYFKGKKSIGHSISPETAIKVAEIKRQIGIPVYDS